jgi:hypothetical protein
MAAGPQWGDSSVLRAHSRAGADLDDPPRADAATLDPREIAFVHEWARSSAFNPYRNYRLISKAEAAQVLAAAVLEPGPHVAHLWHRDGAAPAGLIRVAELPWDSELYERKMGRITHLCGDLDAAAIRTLLDGYPFDHLAARVDASDIDTQRALIEAGFFPADSILRFLHYPSRGAPPEPVARRSRARNTFRKYESSDRESVLSLTAKTYARYPGRYHVDPWLRQRSTERYVRWAEKYVDGEADTVWVSESNGRLVGYLAFRYNRTLQRVLGMGCYGAGLGASRGGDYQSLCRHALMFTKDIPWQISEFETQIDNYRVHRIYRDLDFDYAHAEHTYHLHRT